MQSADFPGIFPCFFRPFPGLLFRVTNGKSLIMKIFLHKRNSCAQVFALSIVSGWRQNKKINTKTNNNKKK
jgi:hypothetical protein